MTTALLADDELLLRDYLQSKLQHLWPELEIVALAKNGIEAAEKIRQLSPDVAFLDIQMPGLTGLEVAKGIETPTRVVFITAFDEFAVEAFERQAIDYLLKPVTDERLIKTIDSLKRSLAENRSESNERLAQLFATFAKNLNRPMENMDKPAGHLRWIRASRGSITYQIPVTDVIYFQSVDKYTTVVTTAGEHIIRTSLAELMNELDTEMFWQIHRSTVVNVHCIESTRRDHMGHMTLTLTNQAGELSVSRAYMYLFKQM
jgi:DNA-binding LytR/AlgR family response regulator